MRTTTQRDYEERILRVLVHIQAHLDRALDLDELAAVANFSPYHFHRIFRGMVGEPVKEHVRRLRLERAAYRLKAGSQPVIAIAFDAGYEAHETFTRAFRSMFGQSPSAFRGSRRAIPQLAVPSGVHFDPEARISGFRPIQTEDRLMNIRVENVEPMRVAFMRHVGPYTEVGQTWQRFCQWVGMHGLFGPNTKMLGISHDDPDVTPSDKLRYDACVVVGEQVQPEGEVGVQQIPGGEYVVATHQGPYEQLNETYAALMGQWLPANGREPRMDPCLEFYLNDPQTTAPEELLTDVCVPLKPARGGAGPS